MTRPKWRAYEDQVFALFREHLPQARLRQNVKLRGRFSKRKRQIDILIVEKTPAGKLRTVVDTKHFGRKVNVKAVDGLAGFAEDVGAERGMLITNVGYTRAALRRAFYAPRDLELDILNFSELQRFQTFTAIPYAGNKGFLVPAPLGWVIDATRTRSCLAMMYQRGFDAATARGRKEFIYVNFWDRRKHPLSAKELDDIQSANLRQTSPAAIRRRETIHRPDAVTRLRVADVKSYGCLEVTGFLEFRDVIFFAVLLTPKETQRPNIRRLESVLRQAIPIDLVKDNTPLINAIQERLGESLTNSERAQLLLEIGHWYRDMDQFTAARDALNESLSLDSSNYYAIKELLPVLARLDDKETALALLRRLLGLDPHNPTVFNDAIDFIRHGFVSWSELLGLIDATKAEHLGDRLVQANCDFYAGQLLMVSAPDGARKRFQAAKNSFRDVFPRNHHVFAALRAGLAASRRQR